MKLLEVTYNLSWSMNWILNLEIIRNHWSDTFIVLREYCLKDTEIILCHLKSNLVKNIDKLSVRWILTHVECWWLQTLGDHVVPVENFLWKNHKYWINLFVIQKPNVFQFKNFTHEEIFKSLIILVRVFEKRNRILIFKRNSLRKVRRAIII